jgi:hypothetical protein
MMMKCMWTSMSQILTQIWLDSRVKIHNMLAIAKVVGHIQKPKALYSQMDGVQLLGR